MSDYKDLDGLEISDLLREQPQLIDQLNIDKMYDEDIEELLQVQPHLAKHFNK